MVLLIQCIVVRCQQHNQQMLVLLLLHCTAAAVGCRNSSEQPEGPAEHQCSFDSFSLWPPAFFSVRFCLHDSCCVFLTSARKGSNFSFLFFLSTSAGSLAKNARSQSPGPMSKSPQKVGSVVLFLLLPRRLGAAHSFLLPSYWSNVGLLSYSVSARRLWGFALLLSEAVNSSAAADSVLFMSAVPKGPLEWDWPQGIHCFS